MISNWKRKVFGYTAQGGSGGGSSGGGQATQSNQYSNISPWAQPYVNSILGAAQQQVFNMSPGTTTPGTPAVPAQYDDQGNLISGTGIAAVPSSTSAPTINGINPYTAYGQNGAGMSASDQAAAQASVSGFTPLQQQSFNSAANMQTPGQFNMATGSAGQGITQALGSGQGLQNQLTNQNTMAQYMNPYLQQSLAPQLQLLAQQTGINSAAEQGAATSRGAFGGSREALMNGLNQQSGNLAAQQMIGTGYNQAYNNAQTQANNVANLNLQGGQSGISGANALANVGTSQLAAQQGIAGLQNLYGTQQQQNQQNVINQSMQNYQTAQQYPMQQLSQLNSLLAGKPITDVTTTQQAAAPTTFGQITGLGLTGLGAYGAANSGTTINTNVPASKKGGVIKKSKKYSMGGIVELSLYNAMKGQS
jgi:hypothetical protein